MKIDSLSFGGCGVGRVAGKVVFVPYSAPGDEVKIEVTREEKGFMEANIRELIVPSPIRKEPSCSYHSVCGGCHWLHIPYDEQLKSKEEIFKDTLQRIGKIDPSIVGSVQPSAMEFNYRNRVQFKVWENKIGFYKRGTHELVDISECPLSHPLINKILKGLREIWPQSETSIERIDINVSPTDERGTVSFYLKGKSHIDSVHFHIDFAHFFKMMNTAAPDVTGLIIHHKRREEVYGSPFLFSKEGEFRFRSSEGGFSQVNYRQNLNMKDYIISLADLKGVETVLELYSGGGNFTIPLARHVERVYGVEVSPSSISNALKNLRLNHIKNATFVTATAEKGLAEAQNLKTIDLIVVDPPRDGCSQEVVGGIAALKPKKVIYVSCNPSTLARDLGRFKALGYKAGSSKPFDMFPQTYHIESVTELVPF